MAEPWSEADQQQYDVALNQYRLGQAAQASGDAQAALQLWLGAWKDVSRLGLADGIAAVAEAIGGALAAQGDPDAAVFWMTAGQAWADAEDMAAVARVEGQLIALRDVFTQLLGDAQNDAQRARAAFDLARIHLSIKNMEEASLLLDVAWKHARLCPPEYAAEIGPVYGKLLLSQARRDLALIVIRTAQEAAVASGQPELAKATKKLLVRALGRG
jgi:hypothetical protein